MLTNNQISESLSRYGISPDGQLCDRIQAYISLLWRWNERISLTTITDPDEIVRFHFGESFFAVRAIPIKFGRLADVGSGAGFPGIPIAMTVPEADVTLIEANLRKSTFLSEVIRTLHLQNARVVRARMEDFSPSSPFGFVTARAVGQQDELLSWARKTLADSGTLALWTTLAISRQIREVPSWSWRSPVSIPGSDTRCLLIGSRHHGTGHPKR